MPKLYLEAVSGVDQALDLLISSSFSNANICLRQFTPQTSNSHWMTNAQLLGDFSIDNYSCIAWATIQAQFRGTEQYTVSLSY